MAGRQGGEEENLDGPSSHDQPPEPIHCPVLRLRHMECTCQFCVVECVIAVCLMCVSIVYMCIRVLQVSLCEYSNKLVHPSYYPPSRSHSPSPPLILLPHTPPLTHSSPHTPPLTHSSPHTLLPSHSSHTLLPSHTPPLILLPHTPPSHLPCSE